MHMGALRAILEYNKKQGGLIAADQDRNGLTILHLAVLQGDDEMLRYMRDTSQSSTRDFYKYYSLVDEIIFASCKCAICRLIPSFRYARILCLS